METIQILAGTSSSGSPVYEEVVVEDAGEGRFRLMQSPGLAPGLAAGDVFELFDDCRYHVVSRGGTVCIQVYLKEANPKKPGHGFVAGFDPIEAFPHQVLQAHRSLQSRTTSVWTAHPARTHPQ